MTASDTPADTQPKIAPFVRLGGAPVIAAIVDRFYGLMDSEPEFAELRAMHAQNLAPMREALGGFLTGWSGGPRDWFEANPGKCMMSMHAAFPISEATAQQWADCIQRAIAETETKDADMAKAMAGVLEEIALGMIKKAKSA